MRLQQAFVLLGAAILFQACASTTLDVSARGVRADAEALLWRPATRAEVVGHWRLSSVQGPAAAVLLDIAYWIAADGRFTGAALFVGPPPAYEVLAGEWALGADGQLTLGADAEPALVEVAGGLLKIAGTDGSLVLERAEIQ